MLPKKTNQSIISSLKYILKEAIDKKRSWIIYECVW